MNTPLLSQHIPIAQIVDTHHNPYWIQNLWKTQPYVLADHGYVNIEAFGAGYHGPRLSDEEESAWDQLITETNRRRSWTQKMQLTQPHKDAAVRFYETVIFERTKARLGFSHDFKFCEP